MNSKIPMDANFYIHNLFDYKWYSSITVAMLVEDKVIVIAIM